MLSAIMLSVIMLSVIMLSVIMLNVAMLNVVMLSVMAPDHDRIQPQRCLKMTAKQILTYIQQTKRNNGQNQFQ